MHIQQLPQNQRLHFFTVTFHVVSGSFLVRLVLVEAFRFDVVLIFGIINHKYE